MWGPSARAAQRCATGNIGNNHAPPPLPPPVPGVANPITGIGAGGSEYLSFRHMSGRATIPSPHEDRASTRLLEQPPVATGHPADPVEARHGRALRAPDPSARMGVAGRVRRSSADAGVPIRSGDRGCLGGVESRDAREGLDRHDGHDRPPTVAENLIGPMIVQASGRPKRRKRFDGPASVSVPRTACRRRGRHSRA